MMSNKKITGTLLLTLSINILILLIIIVKSSLINQQLNQQSKQTFIHFDVDRSNIYLTNPLYYLLAETKQNTQVIEVEKKEQQLYHFLENYFLELLLNDKFSGNLVSRLNAVKSPGQHQWWNDSVTRLRRSLINNVTSDHAASEQIQEIFSTLNSGEKSRFRAPVSTILIPALTQFESMVRKKMESLHNLIVSHDLRLEVLEKAMLSSGHTEQQLEDKKKQSESENLKDIIRLEELLPVTNTTTYTEETMAEDGSGETLTVNIVTSPTNKPTQVENWKVPEYYEIFRHLTSVEQKVLALENYNVMSDSELNRVRSEVIKMDDKVTELDRRNRNLQVRMSMHAVKLSELELFKNKAETALQVYQDSYGRVNMRLEAFKDRLAEVKTELRGVTSQFTRHDQIANELRSADSYKAHDIQEMRKSIFGLEGRLTSLYTVLDQNIQMITADIKNVIDRICTVNKLTC